MTEPKIVQSVTVTGPYQRDGDLHPCFRIDTPDRHVAHVYCVDGDLDRTEREARAMADAVFGLGSDDSATSIAALQEEVDRLRAENLNYQDRMNEFVGPIKDEERLELIRYRGSWPSLKRDYDALHEEVERLRTSCGHCGELEQAWSERDTALSRVRELEENEAAYERILGERTYQEVADEVSRVRELEAGLREAQTALAMLTAPAQISNSTVIQAWSSVVSAEAKARSLLTPSLSREMTAEERTDMEAQTRSLDAEFDAILSREGDGGAGRARPFGSGSRRKRRSCCASSPCGLRSFAQWSRPMILWLDHLIFGSGYGMGTPYFDGRFYWLSGELYTFSGGLGAQLRSIQWTHPKPGSRRRLCEREFRPFNSTRRWGRVEVSWSMTDLPRDLTGAHAEIRLLERELGTNTYSSKAEREAHVARVRDEHAKREDRASGLRAKPASPAPQSGETPIPSHKEGGAQ